MPLLNPTTVIRHVVILRLTPLPQCLNNVVEKLAREGSNVTSRNPNRLHADDLILMSETTERHGKKLRCWKEGFERKGSKESFKKVMVSEGRHFKGWLV